MKINLKKIKIKTPIGCYKWERAIKRTLLISLSIDLKGNISNDQDEKYDLSNTIDYDKINNLIQNICIKKQYELIENLCYDIGSNLLAEFSLIEKCIVRVYKKNAIPFTESIFVEETFAINNL
jgi:dihydroneopterin aldolase